MKGRRFRPILTFAACLLFIINTGFPAILNAAEAVQQNRAVPVTDLKVFPDMLDMEIGQMNMLAASFEPANATDTIITWRSWDDAIATVDDKGVVTAVKYGTTLIEASIGEGHSAYCIIRVTDNANTLHKISARLFSGINGALLTYANVTLTDKDGNESRDYVSLNGEFEFNVKNGTYTLQIYEIDHGYLNREITVEGDDIDLGDVFLDGYYIRGFVTSQGMPVEGVLVYTYVNENELRWCITDNIGFYYLDNLAATKWYNVEIADPNYVPSPVKEYIPGGKRNNIILNKADTLEFTVKEEYKDDLMGMALSKLTDSDIFTDPDYLNESLDNIYSRASDDKSGSGNTYIWDGHGNLPQMRINGARWADLYDALGLGEWKTARYSLDEASGFLGAAYYNEAQKDIIIVYGVSDENASKEAAKPSILTVENYSDLIVRAQDFYEEVLGINKLDGYRVSFLTGYGSGGSLAEYVSLSKATDVITFNTQDMISLLSEDILPDKVSSDTGSVIRKRHVNYHYNGYTCEDDTKGSLSENRIPVITRDCFGHDIQVAATVTGSYRYTSCDNTNWALQMESMLMVEGNQFMLTAVNDDTTE